MSLQRVLSIRRHSGPNLRSSLTLSSSSSSFPSFSSSFSLGLRPRPELRGAAVQRHRLDTRVLSGVRDVGHGFLCTAVEGYAVPFTSWPHVRCLTTKERIAQNVRPDDSLRLLLYRSSPSSSLLATRAPRSVVCTFSSVVAGASARTSTSLAYACSPTSAGRIESLVQDSSRMSPMCCRVVDHVDPEVQRVGLEVHIGIESGRVRVEGEVEESSLLWRTLAREAAVRRPKQRGGPI